MPKYFDLSCHEIERQLDANDGEYELRCEAEVEGEGGETVGAELRLNLNCQSRYRQGWTVSLKLNRKRIDCIDHEFRYPTGDGAYLSGWHRHTWDAKLENAENKTRGKVPVPGLDDPTLSRAEFLIRAFKEMQIVLNRVDHGTADLPFD